MEERQRLLEVEVEPFHWWFAARRAIVSRLLKDLVPPRRDKLIVDVGCGGGSMVADLGDSYSVLGVDPSETAIESAQQRFPDIEFTCGPVQHALADREEPADAFLLMDVLEHVEDDRALLLTLIDLLRPGGFILITVPADMSLWSTHDVALGHQRRYDAESLSRLWEGTPTRLLLLSHFNRRLLPAIRIVRRAKRLWARARRGAPSDNVLHPPFLNSILLRIFRGEGNVLVRALRSERPGYGAGVSLLAVLQKVADA